MYMFVIKKKESLESPQVITTINAMFDTDISEDELSPVSDDIIMVKDNRDLSSNNLELIPVMLS